MSKKQDQIGQIDLLKETKTAKVGATTEQASVTKVQETPPASQPPVEDKKTTPQDAHQGSTSGSTPGQMLHKARMAKKWTVEHVAKQLRLAPAYIEEIEADQYTQISSPAYARGYLRAYSRLLEISGDTVIATFNDMNLIQETQLTPDPNVLYNPAKVNSNQTKYWLIGGTAAACLLLIIITMLLPSKKPTTDTTTQAALKTHQSLPIEKPAQTTAAPEEKATPEKPEPEESDQE